MKEFSTIYKALFSIEPHEPDKAAEVWGTLIKKTGEWLYHEYRDVRCNKTGIIRNWLFFGGYWDSYLPTDTAETQVLRAGQPEGQPPKYWTFRLEQRDTKHRERVWRTDLGITLAETEQPRFDLAVTLSYYTLPGHVGKESPEPPSQSLELLDFLFEGETYKITLGGMRLRSKAKKLNVGEGREFVELLKNPQRIFPLVLVRPDENNRFQLEPDHLATLLIGNANVYYFHGDGVDEEMKHFIGFNHAIFRGVRNGIRVYQPAVDFANPDDWMRHRFFIFKNTDNQSVSDIERMIFRGVQRRQRLPFRDFVSFREELYRKEKEHRLRTLREDRTAENDAEYIQLLEEELAEIMSRSAQLSQNLEKQNEENVFAELKIEDLERQLRQKEFERKQLETLTAESGKQISDLQRRLTEVRHFSKLPNSLPDILEKMEALHTGRLLFLPEAKNSAQTANFDDLNAAWSALWGMAEVLWELYFAQNANTATIQQEFQNRTGFDLSLGESKMTREHGDMMQQRIRRYRGRDIEIAPHIKVDKGGKYLRIHYFPDRETRLLVIGHCGDHLDIFSSQRK